MIQSVGGGQQIAISSGGTPIGPSSYAGWSVTQVEADTGGGYLALWHSTAGDNYLWHMNSSGSYQGGASLSTSQLASYEAVFQADLNNDGHLGSALLASHLLI